MQFWLKTKTGPVEVQRDRIDQLRQAGKLSDDMRVVSTDGGQTWLTYQEAFAESPPQADEENDPLASLTAALDGNNDSPADAGRNDGGLSGTNRRRKGVGTKKCFKCKRPIGNANTCPHCNTKQPTTATWITVGGLIRAAGSHLTWDGIPQALWPKLRGLG